MAEKDHIYGYVETVVNGDIVSLAELSQSCVDVTREPDRQSFVVSVHYSSINLLLYDLLNSGKVVPIKLPEWPEPVPARISAMQTFISPDNGVTTCLTIDKAISKVCKVRALDQGEKKDADKGLITPEKRKKSCYLGAPAIFALEMAAKHLRQAFPEKSESSHIGIYLVGSCLQRPDWRDVDVRMIMDDTTFKQEFPGVSIEHGGTWEFDPRWCLMTVWVSKWLSEYIGLPVDFQFQPMSHANSKHAGPRHALGLNFKKERTDE
jgi:hypothetical protein